MLEKLTTEKRNERSMNLDKMSTYEIISLMNDEDNKVLAAIKKELAAIEIVIKACIEAIKNDGRIIYVGAGTSGRIGMLDAVECPPTFGMDPQKVIGILAGGTDQMYAKEEAEDSYELGVKSMIDLALNTNDIVIGLAASGRTPFVIGALDHANKINAKTACIVCNKGSKIAQHVSMPIEIDNGPEILTGSTRLKAGTSQKMVCNMISTATMIGLNKVYENLMVDVDVSNQKLYHRWLSIVQSATNCTIEQAKELYDIANHDAKAAICMFKLKISYEKAITYLKQYEGSIKDVIQNHQ
ncbi:MAG: N-acetylmuramic acid 6-phosphate etherase [Erysipelotrichaceae bacterium]|nr:N-acetylmuramic acid 6-phosphate etherase [Erysipelotrichaceae bacterium]MDY5251934.1 N-acetylmuramic acid 6-phosphate etherase [Erysipelotrichaceae bacterium]